LPVSATSTTLIYAVCSAATTSKRLQQPGALVKLVAEESSFTDPFHFSRVFTLVFGLSPTAFCGLR